MRRRRGALCGAALLTCLASAVAHGHAVVVKTSLTDAPVRADTPTQVTLYFNSRIEPAFTRVTLVGIAGEQRTLDVAEAGDPGRVVVTLPPLAPGMYALRYKVLAADGHVTENVTRFRVVSSE